MEYDKKKETSDPSSGANGSHQRNPSFEIWIGDRDGELEHLAAFRAPRRREVPNVVFAEWTKSIAIAEPIDQRLVV